MMSDYKNEVRDDAVPIKSQSAVFTVAAIVLVDQTQINEFDRGMEAAGDRWAGRMIARFENGTYVGWVSYTARNATDHQLLRVDRAPRLAEYADIYPLPRMEIPE